MTAPTIPGDRGSRFESDPTDTACPQGCTETDPRGRGMRAYEHYTGQYRIIDVPGGMERVQIVERYLECPICGWRIQL